MTCLLHADGSCGSLTKAAVSETVHCGLKHQYTVANTKHLNNTITLCCITHNLFSNIILHFNHLFYFNVNEER